MTRFAKRIVDDSPESRSTDLGLSLPEAPLAVANYAPWIISGGMLYTSGQLPWIDGQLIYKGKIGKDLTPEQGYEACRLQPSMRSRRSNLRWADCRTSNGSSGLRAC